MLFWCIWVTMFCIVFFDNRNCTIKSLIREKLQEPMSSYWNDDLPKKFIDWKGSLKFHFRFKFNLIREKPQESMRGLSVYDRTHSVLSKDLNWLSIQKDQTESQCVSLTVQQNNSWIKKALWNLITSSSSSLFFVAMNESTGEMMKWNRQRGSYWETTGFFF